jgi:dienelactone hydrolase
VLAAVLMTIVDRLRRKMLRKYLVGATLTVALAVLATGCSTSATATPPGFAHAGPYSVGATTFDLGSSGTPLGERFATVFYPADASKLAGHTLFTYALDAPLPVAIHAIIPAKYNSTVVVDAHVDAPGSRRGPFPIVLFSHGFGASRLYYSHLLTGIASWGFIVVSADYLERGLLAQATNSKITSTPAKDLTTMFSSLAATEKASASPSSPLYRIADTHKIAAVGHSAGGQTAFDALKDPRVDVAVGWAPVGPFGPPSRKPTMIIGAHGDIALTPATLTHEFKTFPGPTNFVEISGEGHDTYTDICTSIRSGTGGLVGFAQSLHLVSPQLAKLANNGCSPTDIAPQRFWPIVQYYTVSELRYGLGIDRSGAGLAAPSKGQFRGFAITYRQHS